MRASVIGLLLLLVVGLASADSVYDGGEYGYDDGNYEYGYDDEETHEYPDETVQRGQEAHYYREERPPLERQQRPRYEEEEIPTVHEVNGHQTHFEPVDDGRVCAQSCSTGDGDVIYEPGKQYRYQYHGEVVSTSRATQSEVSRMSVRGYVIITARTQCDLKLQVMNLAVDDVPPQESQWFRESVEKYDLHFSYKNGMVSYLCPNEEEEVVATNFKRGILSSIQAKMTNMDKTYAVVYEADVLGECETEYRISQPSETVVNKTKHNCRHNNHLPYIPHSEHYSRRELSGQLPFYTNDQSCLMHLQDRVWNRVECVEEMEMKEFKDFFSGTEDGSSSDDHDSGSSTTSSLASVRVSTTLVLEAGPEEAADPFSEDGPRKSRASLRMDLEGAIESADSYKHHDSNINEQITVSMDYLVASVGQDSGLSVQRPHAFAHLVNLISQLEREVEIDEIWGTYASQQTSRNFILDAAILCESRMCMKLLTRLAMEAPEAFPESRVMTWLAGVHFHTQSHPESVEYLMNLARNNMGVERQSVMAASSVVYRLCQQNHHNCHNNAQTLLDYATEKVGESCGYGQPEEDRQHVMMALRALSNAGVLPREHFARKCYMNKLMKPDVRVAALQTYRRVSCEDIDFDNAFSILRDTDDDISVRIASYRSMVRCASKRPRFFTEIKQILLKEEVNQVASYVWTHIKNLAERPGGNTRSRELSHLASHHTLQAKFNTNAFRTSRNYRVAQFSKLMNIGGSIDSDLIFTPESFIPRYETHRFHLDFLENSIDAFEIGGAFQGLEGYFDKLFGVGGSFENEDILKVLDSLRPKRDIHDNKIEEFQRLYDESRTKTELGESEEAKETGLYFRVFGNEVFRVENIFRTNPWMFVQQLIQEFSAPRSFQVMKQEFVSPTLLGFPMRFRVNATASVTYERTGDFAMKSMTNFNLEGQVTASAAVAMDETLIIEGYGASSGIRRRSTQTGNTKFGGKLSVQNGKVVDVQFDVPSNELARVSSSVKVALYENYRQSWSEKDYGGHSDKSEYCSSDEMNRFTGLELCGTSEQSIVQIGHEQSFTGDMYSAEYTLSKTDSFDFYKIYYKNQGRNYELMFDTPGSSVDRKVGLNIKNTPTAIQGTLSIPGKNYDLEGALEYTDAMKRFALRYQEDAAVQGEIEISLPISQESGTYVYTPKFLLHLNSFFEVDMDGTFKSGSDVLALEGNMRCSLMDNPLNLKASWERTQEQHKVEGNFMVGEMFGTTSGTLFLNGEKTLIQVDSEYGNNRDQPNTLTLTFDKSLSVEESGIRHSGYLSMESSIGNMNVEMDYDYGSNLARVDTNITVVGTQVTSNVLIKNEVDEDERHLEVTLSLASPQLDVDYLGQVIYKVSDNAFQGEVEVTLGHSFNTKLALQYLYEDDPLHLQGGVHFHLNDFVVQFVHEIDFSQPDMFLITSSDIIGPAVGVLQVEVFYDRLAPFNASVDVHAGYGDKQFGVKAATSSNDEWTQFDGAVDVNWFDWTYSVQHEAQWNSNQKKLILSCETGNHLDIMLQTDPELLFHFLFQRSASNDPDFKYGIERRTEGSSTTYETYLQSHSNEFFHLTATDSGDNTYTGRAKFLESQLEVSGQVLHSEEDNTEVQAQATITFPSGTTVTPQVTFKHTYDGQVRDLMVSTTYNEEVIQGQFVIMHKDGWFMDDTRKVTFTFTSPFDGLKKIGMAYEAHTDWSEPWFAEAEWEELKVRGDLQLGDVTNLEAKLEYQDGGSCDSILHFYHKYDGQHFMSGATLGITKAHVPWSVEFVTTEGNATDEKSLDVTLTFQCPLLQSPFEANGKYKLSDTHFNFECEAGFDSKTKLSFSGENQKNMDTRKLVGALNFDAPWADPVFFNVQNIQNPVSFNVSVDLRTSWEYVHTVGAEFSAEYASPEETTAHFYLTQQNLQVTMEMLHKLSDQTLIQQVQGSFNSVILNYDLNAKWDEDFKPENSDGRLTIGGLLDHNLEFGFTHTRESNRFNTQLTGSWDWYQVSANHLLEFDHPLKWSSTFQVNLPEDNIVMTRLFLNSEKDFSSIESTFHLNSPWTEGFTANLEIHGEDKPNEYDLEATYGDTTIFNAIMHSNSSFQWEKAEFSLDVTSSLFDNCKLKWQHDIDTDNLVALELLYGNAFHIDGRSYLKHKRGFFSQEFESYSFALNLKLADPQLQFETKFGFGELFYGELHISYYDYLFFLKSSIPDNTVFSASLSYPGDKFNADLLYEEGKGNIPDFSFRYARNDIDLFKFKGEFSDLYPQFDAVFTMYYFDEGTGIPKNGNLHLKADLSQIRDYTFAGTMKLTSDFEGFENNSAELKTEMNFTDKIESKVWGQLHFGEWHYKMEERILIDLGKYVNLEHYAAYELSYGDQLYDKKEATIKFNHNSDITEGFLSSKPKLDSPVFSVFLHFNDLEDEFKGYITPGDEMKYELSLNFTDNAMKVKAQRVSEEGTSFNIIRGNISWNLKKVKKQFTVNLTSDFEAIKKVTGQLIIQQRKGLAANVKLRVNSENLTGFLRFVGRGGPRAGKVVIKIDNTIFYPFSTNTSIEYAMKPNEVTGNLKMEYGGQKDWATASIKGSLSESYLKFKLPSEQFKEFDLKVDLETEDKYGLNVELTVDSFCFTFNGSLAKFFDEASLSSNLSLDCSENFLYEFDFRYSADIDNVEAFTELRVKSFGSLFKFEMSGNFDPKKTDMKIDTEFYPHFYHTTTMSYRDGEETSFKVQTKQKGSDFTNFLFRTLTSDSKKELTIEVQDIQVFSLISEYYIQEESAKLDASFAHNIFGYPFDAKVSVTANFNPESGNMEVHLSTNGSFDHADLTVNYDTTQENTHGQFNLDTSNGNAEGSVNIEKSDEMYSVKAEMQSTLHSFENYQFEGIYSYPGTDQTLYLKSVRDDTEFEFNWSKTSEEALTVLNMSAKMPFEKFDHLELSLGYPEDESPENTYKAKVGFVFSNEVYEFQVNHMHHESWRKQESKISLQSPMRVFGNYDVSFMYDLDDQTSFNFKSNRGQFGLDSSWDVTDSNIVVGVQTDLSYFKQGEYRIEIDVPLNLYQKGEISLSRLQTDLDFNFKLLVDQNYRNGELGLTMNSAENTKSYSVSYKYKNRLDIQGQWDAWNISAKAKFTGSRVPVTSGTIDITTDFVGFETITSSWDFRNKKKAYSAEMSFDVNQQGATKFAGSLANLAKGGSRPWESANVKMKFESRYTKNHKLNAEYSIPDMTLSASYEYGIETFEVNLNSTLTDRKGSISLSGNVPINGISTFDVSLEYNFQNSFKAGLKVHVEETLINFNFDNALNWLTGLSELSWSSPFTSPLNVVLKWSFANSPLTMETFWEYGKQKVGFSTSLEYSDNSAHFNLNFMSPFKKASLVQFELMYDFSNSSDSKISGEFKVDEHFLKIESEIINESEQFVMKVSGSMEIMKLSGSSTFEVKVIDNDHNVEFSGQTSKSEKVFFTGQMTNTDLKFTLKYGNNDIIHFAANFNAAEISFAWEDLYLNLTSSYKETGNNYDIDITIKSSEIHPLSVKALFIDNDNYEGSINVKYGEKEYTVTGSMSLQRRSSYLNFRFESSEDSYNPIAFSAKYDFSDFLQGRMKSESQLISFSYEWGEKIQFSLKGQRRGKKTKLNLEIVTPFDLIPELRVGYEGDLLRRGPNIDFNFNSFFEWSDKVAISGLLKLKNNKLNSKLSLTTPFKAFESFSFELKHDGNHLESSLMFNEEEWKISVDYEFSPKYSVSLTVQTPIEGFREVSLNSLAKIKNNKLDAQVKLMWENTNAIELVIVAEMWNLEIRLDTPWEPLKDASFVTSLRTESEELMFNAALKWSTTAANLKLAISPVQSKLEGKYTVDDEEIGKIMTSYHYHSAGLDFTSRIELPFEHFNLFEIIFNLSFEEKGLKVITTFSQYFSMTMEVINYGWEMNIEGSVEDPKGNVPYTFKVNYSLEPENYSLVGKAEVVSDITWVSADIDFVDEWKADANIYNNMISMNLTQPGEKEFSFGFSMTGLNSHLESFDFATTFNFESEFEGSGSLAYNLKGQGAVRHELKWHGTIDDSEFSVTVRLDSDLLETEYDIEIYFPIINFLQKDSKFGFMFGKDDQELYRVTYDMTYPQSRTFTHAILVQFPDWSTEFSASLTRSNFQISFFYPNEETKHTLVVSWPRDISLEKLTLQIEISSPYLEDGDVNVVFHFNVQQRFYFTLTSTISYGSKSLELDSKFQYNKKQRKVTFEATVTSDWVGNYSAMMNFAWLRNIAGEFTLIVKGEEHIAKIQIDREEYTGEFTINSPWISSEELKLTGMINKDIDAYNILVEAKLESNSDDYTIECKFQSNDQNFIKAYFNMKRKLEYILKLSGLCEFKDSLFDLRFEARSDVINLDSSMSFRYDENDERRSVSFVLAHSFPKHYKYQLDLYTSKDWRESQRVNIRFMDWVSFDGKLNLGARRGEIIDFKIYNDISKLIFEVEYDLEKDFEIGVQILTLYNEVEIFNFEVEYEYDQNKNVEFELRIQTPYNELEILDIDLNWRFSLDAKTEVSFYYQWYNDEIKFNFDLVPDSVTGWSVGAYLTTPFEGYEKFGLQTPQFDSDNLYNILIRYPTGELGLESHFNCETPFKDCLINYALHLPFEKYEIVSFQFDTKRNDRFGIEVRVGKVGFALDFGLSREVSYSQFDIFVSLNEYKSEGYFRIYSLEKVRVQFHSEFEMQDLFDIKSLDIEAIYDPAERILFLMKTDQDELLKMHMGWGTDKIVALTTPKVYPGYVILHLESSENLDNFQVEVGLQERTSTTWDQYGFHIQQKQLGYGRDMQLSGNAGQSQFSIEGTITLNPFYKGNFYIKEGFSVELNHKKVGFMTYFQANSGFFENSYNGDLQIMLPNQTLHWDTNAACTSRSFDLLSQFKWNNLDEEEEPITLTIDYDDLLFVDEHTLQVVFSHPIIQNLTLQGNLSHTEDSMWHATAEFADENDPERNIFFSATAESGSESGVCIVQANITQPSSNFILDLDAEITESVFNRASYKINYWSQSMEKWEIIGLTTGIEPVDNGWHFTANLNKSDSNWGYNYNGSLLHQGERYFFDIMSVSQHFMDYWRFETSVNKIIPELDVQLQIGQSKLEPHEIGRMRAGLHSPLELGIIVDHERFGIWRQDARAGLRLLNQDLLQFIVEYDPSYDFTSESLLYRMASPAGKISSVWMRDLTYVASAFRSWVSAETPGLVFSPATFQTIKNYGKNNFVVFKQAMTSSLSTFSQSFREAYTQSVKPALDASYDQAVNMYAIVQPYFESFAFISQEDWEAMIECISIEYVRIHDQLLSDIDRFYYWWIETNHEMTIEFKNNMYEMVRTMNTLSDYIRATLGQLQDTFAPVFESCRVAFERYGQELEAVFGGQCWPRIQHMVDRVTASLAEILYMGEQFVQPAEYVRQLQYFRDWTVEWHKENARNFEDGMSQLQNALRRSQIFEELLTEYEHVKSFVTDVMRDGFYFTFQRRFAEVGPEIVAKADKAVRYLREKYSEFRQYSEGNVIFDYFDAVTGDAFNRVVQTWEQWRANEYQVLDTFQRFFVAFVDGFKKLVQEGASLADESIIFEPRGRGRIVYNQYLPVPWNSFLEGPQWFRLVNIFQKESPLSESRRMLAEGIDKIYSLFEAFLIPGSMMPPFTATATVYGQQITTFDLLHYQFLGSCKYLMAKDFVGGDFEVIGDYSRSEEGEITLKSMIIKAQGGTEVTLHVDGTYDLQNQGSAQVHTDGNYVAFKQGSLFVSCNKISQGCAVTVGSKYFGRLGGLFGNYNYEPSDDTMSPDGYKAKEGNDIANNWAVSTDTCYQANQVRRVTDLSQVTEIGNCHEIFLRSSSPFSRCFIRNDPRPYFWHCVRDYKRPSFGGKQQSPCDAATAYRTQCASMGVHMQPLHQCPRGEELKIEEPKHEEDEQVVKHIEQQQSAAGATCDIPGDTVDEGWSNTYEGATQGSADVAFIIEVANCNKDRNLQLLFKLIKVQLKRSGIQDVRYALVLSQEEGVTVPSELVDEEEINTQLGDITAEGPKSDSGGVEAVKAAARQIKWRPGVSRNIIHLSCRACDDGDAVGEALAENDVSYHVLTKFKVVMNGPNAKKSKAMVNKFYGFDSKRIYTPKDTKKFTGNVNLRKLFQDPEESSCFQAAQASGGSVFNVNKWISKSAAVEKKYLGVIGQRILRSANAPECQECRCLRQGGEADMSCRKCGADWPAVEVQQQVSLARTSQQEMSEGDGYQGRQDTQDDRDSVLQDIRQSFKKEFIENNAAFAHLEQNQEEGTGHEAEAEEEVEREEEEEQSEESEESEERYDDEQEYTYQDYY